MIFRMSLQGSARGGLAETRTRGPITTLARSRRRRPVDRRNRRNERNELQQSATVDRPQRASMLSTNVSTSAMRAAAIERRPIRSAATNAEATSMSRCTVLAATPRC